MYLQNKKPCSCLRKQVQVEHQKFIFSWDIIFMSGINWSDWLCLNTLKAQRRVQWVATPTVLVYPLRLASRGWSSPAILPTWDRTNNRKVISPTPSPLNQRGDVNSVWFRVLIMHARAGAILDHYVVPVGLQIKNLKQSIELMRCVHFWGLIANNPLVLRPDVSLHFIHLFLWSQWIRINHLFIFIWFIEENE